MKRSVKAFLLGVLLTIVGIGLLAILIMSFLVFFPLLLILIGLLILAASLGKTEVHITHLDRRGQAKRLRSTRCIYCGAEFPSTARLCPECGKRNPFVESE